MALRFPIAVFLGCVLLLFVAAYDGPVSIVALVVVAPFYAGVACMFLTLIGAPLLIDRVWRWWRRVWYVPVVIAALGVATVLASWLPPMRVQVWDPEFEEYIESFHPMLFLLGWSAVLFGALWCPKLATTADGRWA